MADWALKASLLPALYSTVFPAVCVEGRLCCQTRYRTAAVGQAMLSWVPARPKAGSVIHADTHKHSVQFSLYCTGSNRMFVTSTGMLHTCSHRAEPRLDNSCRNTSDTRAGLLHKPPKTHFVRSGKPICAPRLPGEEPSTSYTEILNEYTDTVG